MSKPTKLYHYYDAAGVLLYVGISTSALIRLHQHRQKSEWFDEAVKVEIENFPSREAAMSAEQKAIRTEKPKFNIQHSKTLTFANWVLASKITDDPVGDFISDAQYEIQRGRFPAIDDFRDFSHYIGEKFEAGLKLEIWYRYEKPTKNHLAQGTRVKTLVRTMCGWQGTGVVVELDTGGDDDRTIEILKDGFDFPTYSADRGRAMLCRYQLRTVRNSEGEAVMDFVRLAKFRLYVAEKTQKVGEWG